MQASSLLVWSEGHTNDSTVYVCLEAMEFSCAFLYHQHCFDKLNILLIVPDIYSVLLSFKVQQKPLSKTSYTMSCPHDSLF